MKDFWKKLKEEKIAQAGALAGKDGGGFVRPIIALAPMANVTDAAFRRIIAKYGKPDVMWTEFVSADGLFMGGNKALMKDLIFSATERPIVAQFFTARPEMMKRAAQLARELGFDGIDINMGCPDRSIEKQGAGAAMIKNPALARAVLRAAKEGAGDLPVSVKTRIGFNKNELDTWLPELLAEEPAVITIHARTRKEMSKVPARWEEVKRAVEIRDRLKSKTLIFGNGDALDIVDAEKKAHESGADGVMLGRAIFGNPWLFAPEKMPSKIADRLKIMVEHTYLFEELLGETKNFAIMKKHYKAYVNGWDGAKELRVQLMEAETASQIEEIVKRYINSDIIIT
ncbi:tRNA-dihydrouridine synthase [Candidatus Parcubacteria bacterium]|nr:tRNA-dihydrouridine synthase [Candidatus Parcubacteria bacterium]